MNASLPYSPQSPVQMKSINPSRARAQSITTTYRHVSHTAAPPCPFSFHFPWSTLTNNVHQVASSRTAVTQPTRLALTQAPTHLTLTWPKCYSQALAAFLPCRKQTPSTALWCKKAPGKPSTPAEQSCSFLMWESCKYAEMYKQPRKLTVLFNSMRHHLEAGKRRNRMSRRQARSSFEAVSAGQCPCGRADLP